LKQLEGKDRNDLAAQLCGFDNHEIMQQEIAPQLSQEQVFELVKCELTAHGVRETLLYKDE